MAFHLDNDHKSSRNLLKIFSLIAGDEKIGLLAYVILRSRMKRFSKLRSLDSIRYDGTARARHTRI
jgi:hypothetical protein